MEYGSVLIEKKCLREPNVRFVYLATCEIQREAYLIIAYNKMVAEGHERVSVTTRCGFEFRSRK